MSLADYLASKYLTADQPIEKKTKKRKRKAYQHEPSGIHIADDDDDTAARGRGAGNDDDDLAPQTLSNEVSTSAFRKARQSNWTAIGAPTPSNADQAAADAIIASAAAEHSTHGADDVENDDERPQVLDPGPTDTPMTGLQTAAQIDEAMARKQAKERRAFDSEGGDSTGKGQETIYRDASGRIINVAMKRAEARRKAEEEEQQRRHDEDAARGDVQLAERDRRRQQLDDAKYKGVARYADDVELNAELQERERWNDPAAMFLTSKKNRKSVSGKPLFKGAAPPNRYGIRPGYRWDGVDRGTGFEKEYFAAQNKRKMNKDLSYAWEMDE